MTPSIRPTLRKLGGKAIPVQPKVPSRSVPACVNPEDQRRQFREARLARERERFDKLRDCRMKNSSAAASYVSSSVSITSNVPCPSTARPQVHAVKRVNSLREKINVPSAASSSSVNLARSTQLKQGPSAASSSSVNLARSTQLKQGTSGGTVIPQQANRTQTRLVPKPHKSATFGRRSILKLRLDKAAKSKTHGRKAPKVDVKLTRTTQLRLIKADPLFDLSKLEIDKHKRIILPPPERFAPKQHMIVAEQSGQPASQDLPDGNSRGRSEAQKTDVSSGLDSEIESFSLHLTLDDDSDSEAQGSESQLKPPFHLKKNLFESTLSPTSTEKSLKLQSPSRIPVKKTSFVSPMGKTTASTPKPSPLREKLAEWLEKRQQSLDSFKHLKCFGILGPCVKRPQTPFRKVLPTSSVLKAIPESKESTPSKETDEDSCTGNDGCLNTTFTLEEEDKENIVTDKKKQVNNVIVENQVNIFCPDNVKELDQSRGVLLELHKVILMGYPVEQCNLWLRAIRRRFPQCGDEAVYWECLASLEESRGDLKSAVSCYERAIMQGAEDSVQKSLEDLLKKISELNIETASPKRVARQHENSLLDSSNIIKSSAIQFEVQEKCNMSVRKDDAFNESCESMFTATPVRRSTRLATTPQRSTPGVTCVRSLDYLEPTVRKSLVFHSNKALEPRD